LILVKYLRKAIVIYNWVITV